MSAREDPRLAEAKAMPMAEVVDRLGLTGLRRAGVELVGPCPQCGGTDRFGVNLPRAVFGCRRCAAGGDQVALVRHVLGMEFLPALDWLCGPADGLTEVQLADRRRKAEANRRRQAEVAARKRKEAIALARALWNAARPAEGTPVRAYLARRGIPAHLLALMPACLRYLRDCRYTIPDPEGHGRWLTLRTGPAMIAAVQDAHGIGTAVHRTWIDLDRPDGKARIVHPATLEALPAKKVLGSKKGGAICLRTPRGATTLVMGEGIETTLSALVAEDPPMVAAFWAGVDLGNIAGRQRRVEGVRHSGLPDMADAEAFVPPAWVRRLIYVQDGDSDPRATRMKLQAGLIRAQALRPGLTGAIVRAAEGRDLNDMLRGG